VVEGWLGVLQTTGLDRDCIILTGVPYAELLQQPHLHIFGIGEAAGVRCAGIERFSAIDGDQPFDNAHLNAKERREPPEMVAECR